MVRRSRTRRVSRTTQAAGRCRRGRAERSPRTRLLSGCETSLACVDMMRSATDLSKADLHVFSKLFDDGLERGQEAKAFSGRQIGGHDDVLDFFVGHLINGDMTRQPAP